VTVGNEPLLVAVANEPVEWAEGLMGVGSLGDIDGMLFVLPQETMTGFWMKDTLIPLDIAFFGQGGDLVDFLTMEPCLSDPCPSYASSAPFMWALETPAGRLGVLEAGTTLSIEE